MDDLAKNTDDLADNLVDDPTDDPADDHAQYQRLFRITRSAAERGGITWRLSLEDFIELWRPHWLRRREGRLQLSRVGYAGAYEKGNVRVDTRANHVREQHALAQRQRGEWPSMVRRLDVLWNTATPEQIALARAALDRYKQFEGIAADSLGLSVQSFRILLSKEIKGNYIDDSR
jgi:hypothetical protein